jgi:hypothetical protein
MRYQAREQAQDPEELEDEEPIETTRGSPGKRPLIMALGRRPSPPGSQPPGRHTLTMRIAASSGALQLKRQAAATYALDDPGATLEGATVAPTDPESGSTVAVFERLGAGVPLPSAVAARMESAFGERFDDVRIHTDQAAQTQVHEQGALACTIGHHVAFAAGQFRPGTPEGDALLAHELAHVQQQRGGDAQALARKAVEASDEPAAERDADRVAEGVLRRLYGGVVSTARRIGASLSTGLGLKRWRGNNLQTPAPDRDAAPAATEASVTTALEADPVDPVVVLTQLRQLAPVGENATPGPLDTLIDTRLTGDARWRAQNIRRYGPENRWPPILRGDTAAIISAAQQSLRERFGRRIRLP